MRIAIFLAHPREDSFCRALADAYQDGAASAGAEVKLFWIDGFEFTPILHESSPRDQPLEPALREAQRLFTWADHLVFVFPTWWATMPALLKGFFDRALVPGYAFYVDERSPSGSRPLLAQRSARLITTMPPPRLDLPMDLWPIGITGDIPRHLGFPRNQTGADGARLPREASQWHPTP